MKHPHLIGIPRIRYAVLCLLLLSCAGMDKPQAGQAPTRLPAAESSESFPAGCRQVYAGTVGGSAVELILGRSHGKTRACEEVESPTSQPASGHTELEGYYYYLRSGRTDPEIGVKVFDRLWLNGQLDGQGHLVLTESMAGEGTSTGRFEGSKRASGEITGAWSDADGKRSLPFSLQRLDGAAQNGAVAFCTACADKAESDGCAKMTVKVPGEPTLDMGPVFKDEDRYEIDSSAVMNSVEVMLLPGSPALYHVSTFASPACDGPSGFLYGEEHSFHVRGGHTQPVLTFSGGQRTTSSSGSAYTIERFRYQGSELEAFTERGLGCSAGSEYCHDIDNGMRSGYRNRTLSLQRYRIAGRAAVPLGEALLQKETVFTVSQSEEPAPTVSFVDDGTGGWLELSADYPLDLDTPALPRPGLRWVDPERPALPPRPGRWCWLYEHNQPRGRPSPWHPTMPRQALQRAVAIAEFDPAEVEFNTTGTENSDESKNSAVAVWLKGRLLAVVVGAEQTCYSQAVTQVGPWGNPLDEAALNLYRRLFPSPFPEKNRIMFAPGHSSATLRGAVAGGSESYGIHARKGQMLTVASDAEVNVRTTAGRELQDEDPHETRVAARLPRTGDYVIKVTPADGITEFSLTVEIR